MEAEIHRFLSPATVAVRSAEELDHKRVQASPTTGEASGALAHAVRRAGLVVVKLLGDNAQQQASTRSHVEMAYVEAAHEGVWGGRDADVVWRMLFAQNGA